MKDSQKFTMTLAQLKELVREATGNQEIDEAGVWDTVKGWFGGGKKPAAPAAAAPAGGAPTAAPAQGEPAAQDPAQEQGIVKKLLGEFLQKLTAVKDPFKLRKVLTAIIDSEDAMEAIQSIQQIKKEADAEDAAKQKQQQTAQGGAPEGQEGQEQPEQQQATESLLEDDENPWGSWEPSAEEVAQHVFNHYEEITSVPKSFVYDVMLNDRDVEDLAPAYSAIKDWMEDQGLDGGLIVDALKALDQLFAENKPEEVDEGLWDRFKAKAAGWAGTAKAAGHNINRWANSDDQGNSDIKKQNIWGAGQTEKFATLINQYIKKIEWLKNAIIKANEFYRKDVGRGKLAADMVAKMDAFIQQANAALKQTQDELKANNYDRKAADKKADDAGQKPEDGKNKDADDKKGDDDKDQKKRPEGDEKDDGKKQEQVKESALADFPDDGKPHDYKVYFTSDAAKAKKPEMTLNQVTRKEAFEKIGEVHGDLGEDPWAIYEDDKVVLGSYFDWCETGTTGLPGEVKKHKYVAVFDSTIDLDDEDVVLGDDENDVWEFEAEKRASAYVKLAEKVSQTGEFPVKLTEDGVDILSDFTAWCDSDMVDEGLWDTIKGAGQAFGKQAKQTAKNAAATTMGAAKELGNKKAWSRSSWTLDDYANKLARIVAELETDLKDMSWSPKQNPGLAKVIKDLEVSANEIHKKGEQGQASNWDKVRHQAGKMAGAAATGAVQGLVLGALLKPLRSFMSPRWYAALVAAATVLLRALMRNMEKMDLKDDDKEEKAAASAALAKGEAMNPPNAGAEGQPAAEPAAGGAPAEPAPAEPTATPAAPAAEPPVQPAAPAAPPAPALATSAPTAPAQPAAAPAQPTTADAEFAKRSAAAKKGAQTRAANQAAAQALHQKRSDAAKRGAQTRAANKAAQAAQANRYDRHGKGGRFISKNRNTDGTFRKVRESQKFTLTIGQLRKLIQEACNG